MTPDNIAEKSLTTAVVLAQLFELVMALHIRDKLTLKSLCRFIHARQSAIGERGRRSFNRFMYGLLSQHWAPT